MAYAVSTIFIAGLPADATARELENSVRFIYGFEAMKMTNMKGGAKGGSLGMFVKFQTGDDAYRAIDQLNGVAFDSMVPEFLMRVEMARTEMKPQQVRAPVQTYEEIAAPFNYRPEVTFQATAPPWGVKGGGKVAKGGKAKASGGGKAAGATDTIMLQGVLEQGFSEYELDDFCKQLPGFVAFKANPKIGGGFVKLESPEHAADAANVAIGQGLNCVIARTSMNIGGDGGARDRSDGGGRNDFGGELDFKRPYDGGKGHGTNGHKGGKGSKSFEPPSKRPRQESSGTATVDTLVLLGAIEQGFTQGDLEEFFSQQPGFVTLKPNPRVGGAFVKFTDPEMAVQALGAAVEKGYPAQLARTSMSS